MTFRRVQDREDGFNTRVLSSCQGVHTGFVPTRQPDAYAGISDLKIANGKLILRMGTRKNQTTGFNKTVSGLFPIGIGLDKWLGTIIDGKLQVTPVSDVVTARSRSYTWDEIRQKWTWEQAGTGRTWNDFTTRGDES